MLCNKVDKHKETKCLLLLSSGVEVMRVKKYCFCVFVIAEVPLIALRKYTIIFYYLYNIPEASSVVITKNSIADIRKKEGNNSKPPHGNNSTIHPFKTQLLLPAFLIRNSPFVLLLKYYVHSPH